MLSSARAAGGFRVLVDGTSPFAQCGDHEALSSELLAPDALRGSQWLRFIGGERRAYDGHHVAIYVRDFRQTFVRALEAGVVYDNPRYSDRGGTFDLALANKQFRTLCMHPCAPGACGPSHCFQLELEVRTLDHPACPL